MISTLVLTERYVKKTLRLHTVKITLILLIQKKGLLIKRTPGSLLDGQQTKKETEKPLTYKNVAAFLRQREIRSYTELLATTKKRKLKGQNGIAEFVLRHSEKNIRELITKTWLMQYALAKLERSKASCMEEIETAAAKPCKAG